MKSWQTTVLGLSLMFLAAASGAAQTIEPVLVDSQAQVDTDPATTVAPTAPSRLQALAVSTGTIFLVWQDNSNNESNFRIEVSTGGGAFAEVGTVAANTLGVFINGLAPGTAYTFRVRASNSTGNSAYSNQASATTRTTDTLCSTSDTEMCLNNNRFRIQALYQTTGTLSGQAHTVKLTPDSGYLWFFNQENIEAVVKVLNACGTTSNRYWFFAGGLTNVRVVISVTDTQAEITRVYMNPINTAFLPIQDTGAFNTCP
jgi:hypothetical protein